MEKVIEKAFINTVKDCLIVLDRYDLDYSIEDMVIDQEGEYIKVKDIEQLFNIKL